jgi:predicted S18 family serine protease
MYQYKRPHERNVKRKIGMATALIMIVISFVLGYFAGGFNEITIIYQNETRTSSVVTYVPYGIVNMTHPNSSYASITIPAVEDNEEGVTTVLTVQVVPGNGRILANIDKLLFWTDTQNSIRTSSKVASDVTGIDISKYDIIYTIETNATSVEGPSAGAPLTIATIAALTSQKLDPMLMITGAINHDGTIGPVGQVLAKAKLAKDMGMKKLLVPLLHSQEITYKTNKYCEQVGESQICTTEKVPEKVDIAEEAGIEIIEVGTIEEALGYFLMSE